MDLFPSDWIRSIQLADAGWLLVTDERTREFMDVSSAGDTTAIARNRVAR